VGIAAAESPRRSGGEAIHDTTRLQSARRVGVMFRDLERFVAGHRPCGELRSDVGELMEAGYRVQLVCSCGAAFERWVTPDAADRDLLRSRLLAFPN
jgi:hypothetical protein